MINKKLNLKEIYEIIEMEDKCGVNTLLQQIFSSEFAETGIDVIDDGTIDYKVIKGTTLKIETTRAKNVK